MKTRGGLYARKPNKVGKMEFINRPTEPVVAGLIDTSDDAARGGIKTRIEPGRSPTIIIRAPSHMSNRAVTALAVVNEVPSEVVFGHVSQGN
jgi:hypothetical protein